MTFVLDKPNLKLFDTRPPARVQTDGIPGAVPLDLEKVRLGQHPDLPKDTPLYLVCERGQVSELAGLYLEAAGFTEVYNIAGGMKAYRAHQAEQCQP